MTLLAWLGNHTAGWEIFVPAATLLAVVGTFAQRTSRVGWIPWIVCGTWALTFLALYVVSGVDRVWYRSRGLWATILVVGFLLPGSIPLAASTAFLLARTPLRWQARVHAASVLLAGIITIPLTNVASGFLVQHLVSFGGDE